MKIKSVKVEVETRNSFKKDSKLFYTYKEARVFFNSLTAKKDQTISILDRNEKLISKVGV